MQKYPRWPIHSLLAVASLLMLVPFLWVFKTSCANGKNLVKHKGHIHGWKCVTKRLDTSPVQYDDKVTCKSGSREVQWDFTQDT